MFLGREPVDKYELRLHNEYKKISLIMYSKWPSKK